MPSHQEADVSRVTSTVECAESNMISALTTAALMLQESNQKARMERIKRKIDDDMQLHSDTAGMVVAQLPACLVA